jgi:hypothetical protein
MKKTFSTLLTLGILSLSSGLLSSANAQFVIPNSFSAGTPIRAADMNANFQTLQTELRRLGILSGAGDVGWTVTNTSSANVIYGVVGNVTQGGKYSAGVRGVDSTPGGLSYGVEGRSTNGSGVYGSSSTGPGVVGFSSSGPALKAISGSAGGTALELDGAIKVSGSNKAAFVHTATAANTGGTHITTLDNLLTNGDPNALLFVTANYNPGGIGGVYNVPAIGVYYSGGKWTIFNQNIAPILVGAKFNVLVIKQ